MEGLTRWGTSDPRWYLHVTVTAPSQSWKGILNRAKLSQCLLYISNTDIIHHNVWNIRVILYIHTMLYMSMYKYDAKINIPPPHPHIIASQDFSSRGEGWHPQRVEKISRQYFELSKCLRNMMGCVFYEIWGITFYTLYRPYIEILTCLHSPEINSLSSLNDMIYRLFPYACIGIRLTLVRTIFCVIR